MIVMLLDFLLKLRIDVHFCTTHLTMTDYGYISNFFLPIVHKHLFIVCETTTPSLCNALILIYAYIPILSELSTFTVQLKRQPNN